METSKLDYQTPIGILEIIGTTMSIHSILFVEREELLHEMDSSTPSVLKQAYQELDEYFSGERTRFTLPYEETGTLFQQQVWKALYDVPYAQTCSYLELAAKIGNARAIRAVGNANSRNKMTIIVPCHRIIGSKGHLTGYAGGLWRKEWLLQHERAIRTRAD